MIRLPVAQMPTHRSSEVSGSSIRNAIRQIIETHFRVSLNPKSWSNELARLAFARMARTEAIATQLSTITPQ